MASVKTTLLVLSDTHGLEYRPQDWPIRHVDVAIHCGDLTEESKIKELQTSLELLKHLNADTKLVIAGNHDFTLDEDTFRNKVGTADPGITLDLFKREFGNFGAVRQMFETEDVRAAGIVFRDEGIHSFKLKNGAKLTVYASPWTPSLTEHNWGYQYRPCEGGNVFDTAKIGNEVDLFMTHGPPRGIMDYTDSRQRAGCPDLFKAIARARPRLHCFGHIHEGWGAKFVAWKSPISDNPSYFTDIDNDGSLVVERLASLKPGKFDTEESLTEKATKEKHYRGQGFCSTSHCMEDMNPLKPGQNTLFINASIESLEEGRSQLPWIVDIELERAVRSDGTNGEKLK